MRGKFSGKVYDQVGGGAVSDADLLKELVDLAGRLGIEVRWASGEFKGGVMRLRGARILYLNASGSPAASAEVLCRVLQKEDLSRIFLLPAVRRRLEC